MTERFLETLSTLSDESTAVAIYDAVVTALWKRRDSDRNLERVVPENPQSKLPSSTEDNGNPVRIVITDRALEKLETDQKFLIDIVVEARRQGKLMGREEAAILKNALNRYSIEISRE